jgi:hypothetical protein
MLQLQARACEPLESDGDDDREQAHCTAVCLIALAR